MHQIHSYLLLYLLVLLSCEAPSTSQSTDQPVSSIDLSAFTLSSLGDSITLRDAPGPQGQALSKIPVGTPLKDLDSVSNFTTPLTIDGKAYDEPWIMVETKQQVKGWIYCHPNFIQVQDGKESFFRTRQLQSIFGKSLTNRIYQHRKNYQQIQLSQEFYEVYEEMTSLRDELVKAMDAYLQRNNVMDPPNWFWMGDELPGLLPELVAEATSYYLFKDYRALQQKAITTKGIEDDEYITFCFQTYPIDSVEHFFPAWTIQTWDYGGHSYLGRGIHLQLLQQIQVLNKKNSPFKRYLEDVRKAIVNDMTQQEVSFWESQTAIVAEFDSILNQVAADMPLQERIALEERRKQFDTPQAYGIQLNLKAGLEED